MAEYRALHRPLSGGVRAGPTLVTSASGLSKCSGANSSVLSNLVGCVLIDLVRLRHFVHLYRSPPKSHHQKVRQPRDPTRRRRCLRVRRAHPIAKACRAGWLRPAARRRGPLRNRRVWLGHTRWECYSDGVSRSIGDSLRSWSLKRRTRADCRSRRPHCGRTLRGNGRRR